ncbi:MAG: hypothetical protein LBT03_02345 [Holosporales bacterium]|nr:hypothetical protein [Holosporales bacterium]
MLLNENGINLIRPHPGKRIARRFFSYLSFLNLCFWSTVTACNFLFNLDFSNTTYDAYLFGVFTIVHVIFLKIIVEKLYELPYGNFTLDLKDNSEPPYAFYLKLFLLLLSVFIVTAIAISGSIYGLAYVTYLQNNPRIGEVAFVLSAWNLMYVISLLAGYASCLISTKFLLLPKFSVYSASQKKKSNDNKIINFSTKQKA